jgi:hypothetical protein
MTTLRTRPQAKNKEEQFGRQRLRHSNSNNTHTRTTQHSARSHSIPVPNIRAFENRVVKMLEATSKKKVAAAQRAKGQGKALPPPSAGRGTKRSRFECGVGQRREKRKERGGAEGRRAQETAREKKKGNAAARRRQEDAVEKRRRTKKEDAKGNVMKSKEEGR